MDNNINLVYILGNSYSGSSILGYLLDSIPEICDIGEVKKFKIVQSSKNKKCSCGFPVFECPVWGDIFRSKIKVYDSPSVKRLIEEFLRILFKKKYTKDTVFANQELTLLKKLFLKQQIVNPRLCYLADISKSLWRLAYLVRCRNINLKIIYLKREIKGNVSSFVTHGIWFWKGLFIYKINHFLINRFLKNNDLEYLEVSYRNVCRHTEKVLEKIGLFLGVSFSQYRRKYKEKEHHVPFANLGVQKQAIKGLSDIKYDDKWKNVLTKSQKKILDLIG